MRKLYFPFESVDKFDRVFRFFFCYLNIKKKKKRKYSTRGKITITESNKKRAHSYHIFNLNVSSLSLSLILSLSFSLPCPFIKNSHCEREDSNSATDKWVNTHKIASRCNLEDILASRIGLFMARHPPSFHRLSAGYANERPRSPAHPAIFTKAKDTISIYSRIYTFN